MIKATKGRKGEAELQNALAILIASTHSKVRPLPLTDVAHNLEVALKHLGSYSSVADRIGISTKMLRQFTYVRRLAPSVQTLFKRRALDSVDAATHLGMLPAADQLPVADALLSKKIDTIDLRAVVEQRKLGSKANISALLRRVSDSKVKQQHIVEFVVRGACDPKSLRGAFARHIPLQDIISLHVQGALGRLVLSANGKRALAAAARKLRVPLKHVVPTILGSH